MPILADVECRRSQLGEFSASKLLSYGDADAFKPLADVVSIKSPMTSTDRYGDDYSHNGVITQKNSDFLTGVFTAPTSSITLLAVRSKSAKLITNEICILSTDAPSFSALLSHDDNRVEDAPFSSTGNRILAGVSVPSILSLMFHADVHAVVLVHSCRWSHQHFHIVNNSMVYCVWLFFAGINNSLLSKNCQPSIHHNAPNQQN